MIRKNKLKVLISSVIILLPMLFGAIVWHDLPDVLTTHFGADGTADGFSGKVFAVVGVPLIFLALHFVCLLLTLLDKRQREQDPKALGIIFWIVPVVSLMTNGILYRAAFGQKIDSVLLVGVLFGALFIFMGNYLPKVKQNRTLGIKVSWALNNEENWNKTHRFAGKLWVVCGFVLLLSAFLPLPISLIGMTCGLLVGVIAPLLYSYAVYRRHKKEGIDYTAKPGSRGEKLAVRIAAVVVPIMLVGIAVLMFTGDVAVDCRDTSFEIHATYWTDIEVAYTEIDTAEYRKDLAVGTRINGFNSARMLLGIFQNEEFGTYTLYAYTGAKAFVVLTSDGETLVIGLRDAADTQAVYESIADKLGE